MRRHQTLASHLLVGAATVVALGGCAHLDALNSNVSTFGEWPAGRPPGTYVFERLPSQQTAPDKQQRLEDAARGALEAAGFKPAEERQAASVTVQLGARIEAADRSPIDDPFWWHGAWYRPRFGYGGWAGYGGWSGWGLGLEYGDAYDTRRYEREVAVLIRDRASGASLYEARASNSGVSWSIDELLGAMFAAALQDFPNSDPKPHRVTTQITR